MTKLYNYEEFILLKEIKEDENIKLKCIFEDKNNKDNKVVLLTEFINIENNKYLVDTKIYKYSENIIIFSGNYCNNYIMQESDVINIELLSKIYCEVNTTNLNEYICGFKDIKYNTISFKLWKKDNINFYIGITTSYVADEVLYDYIIVGGGAAGTYSAFKISQENPNSKILVIEENSKTLDDYISKGYGITNNWSKAQNDNDYYKSYLSNDKKFIWLGKGLGGGTLHFGLQYVNNISKNYEEWKEENYKIIDNDLKAIKYKYEEDIQSNSYKPNESWYKFKSNLDLFSLENNINVYNNTIYRTNDIDRLLLGNLLKDLDNVKVIYGKKIDKIIFKNIEKKEVETVKTFDDIYYRGKNIILCAGALETPCILQRSMIECGNKIYDHGAILGLAYGKLEPDKPNGDDLYFLLNNENIKYINDISGRYVFSVLGNNLPQDEINQVYDFTNWVNLHPGGANNITKWRNFDNILVYPHNQSRWISSKSNFTYIGKKDELIKYDNLPDNIKSEELFNVLKNENKSKMLDPNLGFEPEKIVSHLQTRDKNLNWQTYYSTIPGVNDLLILTHAQSINLMGKGYVKINSLKNENPNVSLDYFGANKNEVIDNLLEAYNLNHKFLISNGYILLNPNQEENPITREFIENNIDSIYHYHGTCAIGEVVDENQKVYNTNNLYIGDISVLSKPWGGSTSYAALNTALVVSKNFF